jgi:hypothetical protein
LSARTDTERERAIRQIENAKDVVDILTVLLKICRRHERAVLAASQGREKSEQLSNQAAHLKEEAIKTFTSKGLSDGTRDFAKETLRQASDLAVAARALALGIDLAMQTHYKSAYPTVYRQLCAKKFIRKLKKGDPYPTTSVDLAPMYGGKHGLSSPRSRNAGTAFDSVDGLALWRSPLRAIYDTEAGVRLDHALGQRQGIDILAVSPNGHVSDLDLLGAVKGNTFFGVKVLDIKRQDDVVQDALRAAARRKGVSIVVTPELSSTPQTLNVIEQNTAGGQPPIVIAGGAHVTVKGKQLNRLSTIYTGPKPLVVDHDKIGEYVFADQWKEDIDRSTELCIHAGTNWSMIPLICADLLEGAVVEAVGDLCPRLVVVASMTTKTGDFEDSMGAVIRKSQALIVMVNGPHESYDKKGPVKAHIVVVGMPLQKSGRRRLSPRPAHKPPYMVLVSSQKRSLTSVEQP